MLLSTNCASSATLQQLIELALVRHPELQSGVAGVGAAEAAVDTARWQFFPTPSVQYRAVNASGDDPSFSGDEFEATIGIVQPLWTGGRLASTLRGAKARLTVSQAGLDVSRRDIAIRVVQAYGNWFGAHLRRLAWTRSVGTHHRLNLQVERRANAGVSSQSDMGLAKGRLQSAEAELANTEASQRIALARLTQLVGEVIVDEDLLQNLAIAKKNDMDLQSLLDNAHATNPEILQAQAEVEAVDADFSVARSELWPDINLRIERQYGNFSISDSDDHEDRVFIEFITQFGAGLSSFTNLSRARFQKRVARAKVEIHKRAVGEQIFTDYLSMQSNMRRLRSIELAMEANRRVFASYSRQFLAGNKSWLDVMNSARELAQTEVQMATAKSAQLILSWRLKIASSGVDSVMEPLAPNITVLDQ